MGKFVIKTGKNGEYYFNLKASNGQIILASEGYTSTAARQNGIDAVRKNANDESKFEKNTSVNGKFYFNLKAGNGQIIGKSEMYESDEARNNGIKSVMANAPDATVEEE